MTVGELVNILLDMPQDAEVYRLNENYDHYYPDTEEYVTSVVKGEYGYSITIK